MCDLSENYHLRKCYLQRDLVPTQSMIKKKMSPPLAAVYFKSMNPRLKEIVGLEPSLKGGGNDWYIPPEELLKGRAVLKPLKKQALAKLNHHGIDTIGTELFQKRCNAMESETESVLMEADINWRNSVANTSHQLWEDLSMAAAKKNTEKLSRTCDTFDVLYRRSLNKIENIFLNTAITEIKRSKENAFNMMQDKYATALYTQATILYDAYEKKLMEEKARLKAEFVQKLEISRTDMADKIHDLNVDKHVTTEQLKQFLLRQNLSCEIYVAIKEREECLKEMEESKYMHHKKIKTMGQNIVIQDFEIYLARLKERKRQEFSNTWRKKVCEVVKNFQRFVSYCLNMLPNHAEFFINMEKLMLLQVNEALENPTAESIIEVEEEQFHTPVPQPKPFYLFCDKGYKAQVDQELCPKHSGTSSTSQILPAIIINKRCLYAACDNFEQFTNKIKDCIHGNRGDDANIKDDHIYEHFVPMKYTSSKQLLELKLESSLLQILQQEIDYMNNVSIKCHYCQMPYCICTPCATVSLGESDKIMSSSGSSCHKILSNNRSIELAYEREPKWESYFAYVEPKKCSCAKTAKKHLAEHLPVYMRHMRYGPPEIPDYEMCSVTTLKDLVKKAKKETHPIPVAVPVVEVPSKMKDNISTQYEYDPEYDNLCTCFADSDAAFMLRNLNVVPTNIDSVKNRVVGDDISPSFMEQRTSSFATARALSLRNLVEDLPDLQDIFKKKDCNFE